MCPFTGSAPFGEVLMKKWLKDHHGPILVGLGVLLMIFFASHETRAESIFEIGPSQVSDNYSSGILITATERFKGKYDITGGYITEQNVKFCDRPDCRWHIREQLFVGAERMWRDPWGWNLKIGMGPYWFQNEDRVAPTHFRWGLHAEWQFRHHWGISLRHWSTAGSGGVGCFHTDYDDPETPVVCNDWNTGQDSWLRLTYFAGN